jgi:hypothetical protein
LLSGFPGIVQTKADHRDWNLTGNIVTLLKDNPDIMGETGF